MRQGSRQLALQTSRVMLDAYTYNETAQWADCKEEWAFVNWFDNVFLPASARPKRMHCEGGYARSLTEKSRS